MSTPDDVIAFRHEPPEHTKQLLITLGFRWEVDPEAPEQCPCGCRNLSYGELPKVGSLNRRPKGKIH